MKRIINSILTFGIMMTLITPAYTSFATGDETLNSEELMKELEETVKLNSEKMAKLKPEIDATSEKLKTMVHESVDKGFVRMEEFSKRFDEISKETEVKVKEFLTSEEYEKFKGYLTQIDKEALQEAKNQISEDLNELLGLSEEQLNELKPVLEENLNKMAEMLDTFAKEGAKSWAEVASKYDELSEELKEKLKTILDSSQLEKLDKYKQEKRGKLQKELVEV
ncbi:hypothetical protein [Desulfopila sp. IMCC35008]|uniref:hypothetical protein n=1 Tax=Desulfopila sp. IMCC35008 TaxID=2653858 RepID=UPI0013CFCF1E|nr:hypothetical protein [Desulfopila sp. IMCC35008]